MKKLDIFQQSLFDRMSLPFHIEHCCINRQQFQDFEAISLIESKQIAYAKQFHARRSLRRGVHSYLRIGKCNVFFKGDYLARIGILANQKKGEWM